MVIFFGLGFKKTPKRGVFIALIKPNDNWREISSHTHTSINLTFIRNIPTDSVFAAENNSNLEKSCGFH